MSEGFQIISRRLEASPDAMALFQSCRDLSNPEYRLLLESSEPGHNGKQQSILFLESALKVEARGQEVSIQALTDNGTAAMKLLAAGFNDHDGAVTMQVAESSIQLTYPDTRMVVEEAKRVVRLTSLDAMRQILEILGADQTHDKEKLILAGVVGYDYVNMLESLPELPEGDFPDYLFLLAESQIVIDGKARRTEIRQLLFGEQQNEAELARARGRLASIEKVVNNPAQALDINVAQQQDIDFDQISVTPDKAIFMEQIAALKEGIDQGRIFQAVISREFELSCGNTELAYSVLAKQNPSPYQFYLNLGQYTLFGASPESSLRFNSADRTISIMPIAGTRGRGRNPDGSINLELDARLEADLKLDEKELAEHLMLVDLARNDLARIAVPASRYVSELMAIYRYASVMHMVSRVDAELSDHLDAYHACQACFHMGTLSGAPKAEAMTLISEVEQRRRGTYGGAVGYFTAAGDMDTAIVIRSALVQEGQAKITTGAGIVYDSIPEMEVVETELKASSVLRAINLVNEMEQGDD